MRSFALYATPRKEKTSDAFSFLGIIFVSVRSIAQVYSLCHAMRKAHLSTYETCYPQFYYRKPPRGGDLLTLEHDATVYLRKLIRSDHSQKMAHDIRGIELVVFRAFRLPSTTAQKLYRIFLEAFDVDM